MEFDGTLRLAEMPLPSRSGDEVLVRVTKAGICNTDHEIVAGYMPGFKGTLGHEFLGVVEKADDKKLVEKRVTGSRVRPADG
jgi:threonine dehydrogenase-like Zn-dependent dehydrogenase